MSRCEGCSHFALNAGADATSAPGGRALTDVGICRRYPPRVIPHPEFAGSEFPQVHKRHGCGEWWTEMGI